VALSTTYSRFSSLSSQFGNIPIPKIPKPYTFVNQQLNTRPTLFGCNSTTDVLNADSSSNPAPIIAYIPNYPWTYYSNVSSHLVSLTSDQPQSIIDNAFQSITMAGLTTDSDMRWPTCLACASLHRSFERSGTTIPDKCQACMQTFCWNGVDNDTTPTQEYAPSVGTPPWVSKMADVSLKSDSAGRAAVQSISVIVSLLIATSLCVFFHE
jgi:lysophospholipase